MAYINHQDLATLNELLSDNLTAWEGEEDSVKEEHADLIERLKAFDEKMVQINEVADEGLCDEARALYGSDEIEVDDQSVGVSHADDGSWVNAWLWVPNAEEDEDEEGGDA